MTTNPHFGSSFDDWLKEEGSCEEATADAVKSVLVWQIAQAMKGGHISKAEMASRMHVQPDPALLALDPDNDSVQLGAMHRAAAAVGRTLTLELA
jgi:antitoxin HicB